MSEAPLDGRAIRVFRKQRTNNNPRTMLTGIARNRPLSTGTPYWWARAESGAYFWAYDDDLEGWEPIDKQPRTALLKTS